MNAVHPVYVLGLMAVFALLVLGAVCWWAERRFHPLADGLHRFLGLPKARWGLLDHAETQRRREVSVFRHAVTTNGSLLLDWRNALVGRDVNSPTNLQMELFSDGSFAWRTDGCSASYLPVFPFDYDGDGLENSVDPEPLSPNSIDVHGTTAEWYRIVCSNVFEMADNSSIQTFDHSNISFRSDVNTNAYYFVDVVASEGPAPIYFNADRDSRLGSPVVVARAGETNHMPLLIGVVEYTVTSTVPISVTAPDAMYATVTLNDERNVTVKWPLEFSYSVSGGSYVISVEPYDPGGTIEWEQASLLDPFNIGGGARLLSSPSPSGCGFTAGLRSLTFTCANCSCAGCAVSGVFCVEEASRDLGSFCCGCVYDPHGDDEPGGNPSTPASPDSPSVSVSFSKPVVIFEDAYANTYNQTVDKQSTSTTVSIEAYGGSDGGVAVVSMTNVDKLECTSGPSLPTSFMVSPYSRRAISVGYQGNRASGSADDIVVTAQISGASSSASATAVRLEVVPQIIFPQSCPNRHVFGVCEEIRIHSFPSSLTGFEWESPSGVLAGALNRNSQDFTYLLNSGQFDLTFTFNNVGYSVHTTCFRPSDIVCQELPTCLSKGVSPGEAGGIGMQMNLTLLPEIVSFDGVRVMERVAEDGVPLGYFNQERFSSWWNHQRVQGAGRLIPIGPGNHVTDTAELADVCPELDDGYWSTGSITWTIPCAWKEPSGFSISRSPQDFTTKQQRFLIDEMGTVQVEKFGCRALRTAMGYTTVSIDQ